MQLYRRAITLIEGREPFALAIVVRASGSTPQKAGAKALFERDGAVHGTLGGGCLEAEARKRALDALDTGASFVFDLNLNDDHGWDDGLICGGNVRVFVEPDPARHRHAIAAATDAEGRGALLFQIYPDGHADAHWVPDAEIESFCPYPGSAALCDALRSAAPAWHEEKDATGTTVAEVYIEPVEPAPVLLVAGGGHVGQAVAKLGSWLGFRVTVIDDRAPFADAGRYPEGVRTICGDIATEVAAFPIHESTYVVIATRGHRHDGVVLKRCIRSSAPYIGMIGSKRKALMIRKGLIDDGLADEDDFTRVRSPVGLNIGAVTVEEIAVSILSEIIRVRRNHEGAATSLNVCGPA
ncbi:MAG: XdhC family protein [Candidatus Hydrogenedentes bacterium]|nr:XdhC family protein [Candidatus Hydrogenedentota bacterium]